MAGNGFWEYVKTSIIGDGLEIETPFGKRMLTYADYTASGRGVLFIEEYMKKLLELYANTHTEDDATGHLTTLRLLRAEQTIKRLVNAGERYKIIETGTGATGAIHHLQKILGLYIPPVANVELRARLENFLGSREMDRLVRYLSERRPVVFVGPFEHHSNIVSWRECIAEVVEVDLDDRGLIDIADLERKVRQKEYEGRMKIGSFSAGSNVTGIMAPVYEIARILHRNGAYAFFDFAAIAPYMRIDMMKDEESYFDGIFFSPHKFLGGPGGCGILIIHEKIYHKELPPTAGGGGTVDYVNSYSQDYIPDIETREKPGTPGVLQVMKAALAMELKEKMEPERIERRERELVMRAFSRLREDTRIEIVGNDDPKKRIAIVSFNIRCRDAYLHPRFITRLLNDLFGVQSRAGCLCAGPYGHRLLHIDRRQSERYRVLVHEGTHGLKPGWTRLNFHFLLSDEECDFICDVVRFIAEHGVFFLPLYGFDMSTGGWSYRGKTERDPAFGIEHALETFKRAAETAAGKKVPYGRYLNEAKKLASENKDSFSEERLKTTDRRLIPFLYYT